MIHPTAVVDPEARLGEGVSIGPYTVIDAQVEIGAGTRVGPHVVIRGPTRIGRENQIYQFAAVGEAPQDKSYAGEPTRLELGDRNVMREFVTLHRGTAQGQGLTRVGDDNYFMAYAHVAHDCTIGNRTVFANCASLAGHVTVDDDVILAGFAKVHQFCRLGVHSFCGADATVTRDVPPYTTVAGANARPYGINAEGLKRRGFNREQIRSLREAYRVLYKSKLKLHEAVARLQALAEGQPEVGVLVRFLEQSSTRGIIR